MSGGTRIRVVIVDDIPEARDNVQKLLQFAEDVQVIGQGATGREAIELARKLQPDIILMDVSMPEMDGITATQLIASQFPGVAVIMSSVQSDTETLRRSLKAGARDYLFKPYGLDELAGSIRTVYQSVQANRAQLNATTSATSTTHLGTPEEQGRAKVITVFSPKGGVGRTTIATNLAVATKLATDKRVLLMDGNLAFGDVAVTLNLPTIKTIVELAFNSGQLDEDFVSDVVATHSSGVKVLLAAPNPQEAEGITSDQLRAIIGQVMTMFDYVFIDTRPSFDDLQLALLDLSDTVLLTMTMEMTAIKAAKQYLEVAELLGYPSEKTTLVLNRVGAVSQITVEDVETHLKGRVKGRIPDEPTLVTRSVNEGVPIALSSPESRFSRAINALANIITDGLVPAEEENEQRRGLGGLFRRGAPRAKSALVVAEV